MIQSFLSDVNVLKSLPSIENNTEKFIYTILNDNNETENITFNINNLPEFYSVQFPENYLQKLLMIAVLSTITLVEIKIKWNN